MVIPRKVSDEPPPKVFTKLSRFKHLYDEDSDNEALSEDSEETFEEAQIEEIKTVFRREHQLSKKSKKDSQPKSEVYKEIKAPAELSEEASIEESKTVNRREQKFVQKSRKGRQPKSEVTWEIKTMEENLVHMNVQIRNQNSKIEKAKHDIEHTLSNLQEDSQDCLREISKTEHALHSAKLANLSPLLDSISMLEAQAASLHEEKKRLEDLNLAKKLRAQRELDAIRKKLGIYNGKFDGLGLDQMKLFSLHLAELMQKLTISIMNDQPVVEDPTLCLLCKVNKKEVLFLSCYHLVICQECSEKCHLCCVCNRKFGKTVVVYA